jgi:hypothetical protein
MADFEQSPILAQLVVSRTVDAIELSNRVVVEVRAASYRRLRGITAVAICASEVAFWHDDETKHGQRAETDGIHPKWRNLIHALLYSWARGA